MEGRFEKYFSKESPAFPFDLGLGPQFWKCVLVDRKTGRRFEGWGRTKEEAYEKALEEFERTL